VKQSRGEYATIEYQSSDPWTDETLALGEDPGGLSAATGVFTGAGDPARRGEAHEEAADQPPRPDATFAGAGARRRSRQPSAGEMVGQRIATLLSPHLWMGISLGLGVIVMGVMVVASPPAPIWAGALSIALASSVAVFRREMIARERLRDSQTQAGQLQATEQRYQAAEQMALLGLWTHDLTTQTFQWSPGTFRLFGIDPAQGEPSPRGFLICIHPKDQPRWRDAHRRGIRGGRETRIEYRYLRKGREMIWVRSVARPERDAQGQIVRITGTVQDITGIRAMQQQLASSENKFRELTNMSSDWVWETDDQHRGSFMSDSVDAVLGTWARNAIGKRLWELSDTFGKVDWDEHRGTLEARKPLENFEYPRLDPEGNLFHVAISGRPIFAEDGRFLGYRGFGRDITLEKQQRLLLQIESDIAQIMREQTEPQRVIASILVTVCGLLGWSGGAHLVRTAEGGVSVRERWGHPAFTRMLADLPEQMKPLADSAEEGVWTSGRPVWVADAARHPGLSQRYQLAKVGAKALFLAPVLDENQQVMSALLFLSPVGHRGDHFLNQVADSLSRTLSLYLQRKAAEKRLTHASLHDALTGLPNRVFASHQLDEQLKKNLPVAVLYVDLDRYKIINDTLGHSVGDQVLIEVAQRFRDTLRPQDIAGRMGGDEFLLLLVDMNDRHEIEAMARRVLAAIEKPFILNNRAHFLSASIGVAMSPADGVDAKLLIKCADSAMYQVKSEGRNDVRFFAGGLSDDRNDQLQLASELPLAIQRGEVDLYYQPIFAVNARSVVGIEALLRWRHPTRGLLRPSQFLPMAEQSNLIREIGLWSIRRALHDRVQLGLTRYPEVAVSVNVSARQLAEDGFLATLNRLLAEQDMPPSLLRLELTESAFIESPERTVGLISDMRRMGVKVIIDNFGTGYASLSYLKNLPVDGLKIDRAFVKDLPADRGNAAIVQAVTTLAAKLGLQAMAEGVETSAEMRALRSYECDQMQGTLIAEPMPFAQLQEFMESLPELREMHLVRDITGVP
jgi:diguanylate cyclase (GGDEF)-like protein/PAS domain S-box-containing protein